MITISEAISIVKENVQPLLFPINKEVVKAGGYCLYEDVYSPINMPPFRQSAMDGYAINLYEKPSFKLVGEIKAGDGHSILLRPGEAVRIFTGAPVPDSANAVVMQERVEKSKNKITIHAPVNINTNIRPLGEQVKKGDLALEKNTKLTPATIGYLLSLGITEVSVFQKPNIGIITTGNELVNPGEKLPYGKIYESNSKMLLSALYNLKFYDVSLYKAEDDYGQTLDTLNTAIDQHHLVLITGGISVGDYDFVGKALKELGVHEHFYKVNQKPGKPLFYSSKGNSQIFALPGNPAAALSCFYIYVYIALQNLMNRKSLELPRVFANSINSFIKNGNRPQFLKSIYNDGKVEILDGQNSSMLQTFALANALVLLPEEISTIEKGDVVETILLPEI